MIWSKSSNNIKNNVKDESCPFALTEHHAMKAYLGVGV
jgi:hypothetical protein